MMITEIILKQLLIDGFQILKLATMVNKYREN